MEHEESIGLFVIDDWKQFQRFLIMGSESSVYQPAASLEALACQSLHNLLDTCGPQAILEEILRVSEEGLAPKQSFGLWALAQLLPHHKEAVMKALPRIARTFSTLAEFLNSAKTANTLTWGSTVRRGMEAWLNSYKPQELAYQFTKYRNRKGFTPADVLRLTHPKPAPNSPAHLVYAHATQHPAPSHSQEHPQLAAYLAAADTLRRTTDPEVAAALIRAHHFNWEHVGQQQLLKDARIWKAILDIGMPYTALIRNLRRLLSILNNDHNALSQITDKLTNEDAIKHSRCHPIQILQALRAIPDAPSAFTTALNTAFDKSFKNIEPTNQRFLLAIDVSGSMHSTPCAGMRTLTAAEAAAATALAFMRREPFVVPMAFSNSFMEFPISSHMSLAQVISEMFKLPFSNTDCSAPMRYALEKKLVVDTFIVITDNETNCNKEPPAQVLRTYREQVHSAAKLVVLATSATNISIADPQDAGMLDIAGMDSSVFQVLHQFCMS